MYALTILLKNSFQCQLGVLTNSLYWHGPFVAMGSSCNSMHGDQRAHSCHNTFPFQWNELLETTDKSQMIMNIFAK